MRLGIEYDKDQRVDRPAQEEDRVEALAPTVALQMEFLDQSAILLGEPLSLELLRGNFHKTDSHYHKADCQDLVTQLIDAYIRELS